MEKDIVIAEAKIKAEHRELNKKELHEIEDVWKKI